jgi:hypothetical protein
LISDPSADGSNFQLCSGTGASDLVLGPVRRKLLGVRTRTSVTVACSSPARLHGATEGRTKNAAFMFSWAKSNLKVALRGTDETKAEVEFMKDLFFTLILGRDN